MEQKWFVFADQLVRGPLTTRNVEEGLASGQWTLDTLIWWKGQAEWTPISKWRVHLPELDSQVLNSKDQDWYFETKGQQTGPVSRKDLIDFLKKSANPFQYSIWTPGLPHWKKLYFFDEILSDLGRSRRTTHRAPLPGSVEVAKREARFILQTTTIGSGGLGLKDAKDLVQGHTVHLIIRSPALPNAIRSNAQVLYVRQDGVAGLKFQDIHVEAQSSIIDYVKQFEHTTETESPPLPKKKAS
jgi:hypothetical protein